MHRPISSATAVSASLRNKTAAAASLQSLRTRRCCADDWHAPAQWQRVGLSPPTCEPLSAEEKGAALGGCQLALDGGRGRLSRIFQSAIDNSEAGGPDEAPVRAT